MFALQLLAVAQDHYFINGNQSLLSFNPSFAGSNGLLRDQLSYRAEAQNLFAARIMIRNSFDGFIKPLSAGVAVAVFRDDISRGMLVSQGIDIVYAQHLYFYDRKLLVIPSVQFTAGQSELDLTSLRFGGYVGWFVWNNSSALPRPRISFADISS